jgi:hypothetical protein
MLKSLHRLFQCGLDRFLGRRLAGFNPVSEKAILEKRFPGSKQPISELGWNLGFVEKKILSGSKGKRQSRIVLDSIR